MKLLLTTILPLCAVAFSPSSLSSTSTHHHQQNQCAIQKNSLNTIQLNAALATEEPMTTEELPLYFPTQKEFPKVLGGIKIGLRKLTVITGASSGLGLNTAQTLVNTGRHFVVMAVRDVEKGKRGTMNIWMDR